MPEDVFAWTPEMDAALIDAHGRGDSMARIAAALGCTRNAVAGRLHRLRARGAVAPAGVADATARPAGPRRSLAAADRLGPAPTEGAWLAHLDAVGNPPPFSPAVDLALVEGLAQGRALSSVAALLHVPPDGVRARFLALLPIAGIEAQRGLICALRRRVAAQGGGA